MEDPRFTRVAQDPRFKKISRKERKLKIDGRFEKMFTDKSFTTKYFVDKRGSRVEKTSKEDLHRFYEMSDESDKEDEDEEFQPKEKERKELTEKKVAKSKSKKEKAVKKDGWKMKKKLQMQENDDNKGVGKKSSKNIRSRKEDEDENGSSSEEDIDLSRGEGDVQSSSEEEDEGQLKLKIKDDEIEHPWGEMDVSTKTTKDSTRRLAVCNLDWDRVTATDLFVLFNSFKPRDGVIKSVKIYPSDYGLEQMQKEECLGPVELKDDEGGSENLNENGNTEGSGFSMEKLRQYQLNRLKYYYAVMDCDSPGTAEVLYDECDGTEFELSGNILDLRYIPDDMEFDHEPHSVATGIPALGMYSAPE
ncbi:unnamed protein product [Porites evermanni]|uniref:ESF1 RRM domain-containing protein n=1 Tax=Porites evermanni TaxID=104178 RepID=A0ABN8PRU5_9CNID|nr:unnamed protein product [Porites evermanni]